MGGAWYCEINPLRNPSPVSEPFDPKQSLTLLLEKRRLERAQERHPIFDEVLNETKASSLAQVRQFRAVSLDVMAQDDFKESLFAAMQQNLEKEFLHSFVDNLKQFCASLPTTNPASFIDQAAVRAGLMGPNLFKNEISSLESEQFEHMVAMFGRIVKNEDGASKEEKMQKVKQVVSIMESRLNLDMKVSLIENSFERASWLGSVFAKAAHGELTAAETVFLKERANQADESAPNFSPVFLLAAHLSKDQIDGLSQQEPRRTASVGPRR